MHTDFIGNDGQFFSYRCIDLQNDSTDGDTNELSNPITVKFSVRDKPGALRKSLKIIGVSCSRIYIFYIIDYCYRVLVST